MIWFASISYCLLCPLRWNAGSIVTRLVAAMEFNSAPQLQCNEILAAIPQFRSTKCRNSAINSAIYVTIIDILHILLKFFI